jgi:hypothetical protein
VFAGIVKKKLQQKAGVNAPRISSFLKAALICNPSAKSFFLRNDQGLNGWKTLKI